MQATPEAGLVEWTQGSLWFPVTLTDTKDYDFYKCLVMCLTGDSILVGFWDPGVQAECAMSGSS